MIYAAMLRAAPATKKPYISADLGQRYGEGILCTLRGRKNASGEVNHSLVSSPREGKLQPPKTPRMQISFVLLPKEGKKREEKSFEVEDLFDTRVMERPR